MNAVWKRIQEEPAAAISVVGAFMSLLVLFGVPLSDEQQGGVTFFLFLVAGFLTRWMVTPTAKFDAAVNAEAENIAEAIVTDQAAPLTAEERASLDVLRAERDALRSEMRERGYT